MVEETGDVEASSGQQAVLSFSTDDALNYEFLLEAKTLQRDSWVSTTAKAL